jgi:hypothetical protein
MASVEFDMGITHISLDPYPFSKLSAVTPLAQMTSRGVIEFWASNKAASQITYMGLLGLARDSLRRCNLDESLAVALETITNVESEDPEIHAILGQCALAMGDVLLFREVDANLGRMKTDSIDQLSSFRKRLEEDSLISAIYEIDSALVKSMATLRYDEESPMHGLILPPIVYWEDELPLESGRVAHLLRETGGFLTRVFIIRQGIWRTGEVAEKDKCLWDQARVTFPDWPLFRRLEPTQEALKELSSNQAEAQDGARLFERQGWRSRTVVDESGDIVTRHERPKKERPFWKFW